MKLFRGRTSEDLSSILSLIVANTLISFEILKLRGFCDKRVLIIVRKREGAFLTVPLLPGGCVRVRDVSGFSPPRHVDSLIPSLPLPLHPQSVRFLLLLRIIVVSDLSHPFLSFLPEIEQVNHISGCYFVTPFFFPLYFLKWIDRFSIGCRRGVFSSVFASPNFVLFFLRLGTRWFARLDI